MDWLAANSMRTVLLRHFPELRAALRGRAERVHPLGESSLRSRRGILTKGPDRRPGPLRAGPSCGRGQSKVSAPVGSTCSTRFIRCRSAASSAYIRRRARLEFPSGRCAGRLCHGL